MKLINYYPVEVCPNVMDSPLGENLESQKQLMSQMKLTNGWRFSYGCITKAFPEENIREVQLFPNIYEDDGKKEVLYRFYVPSVLNNINDEVMSGTELDKTYFETPEEAMSWLDENISHLSEEFPENLEMQPWEEDYRCNHEGESAETYRKRGCIKRGEFFGRGLIEDGDLMANVELTKLLDGIMEIPNRPCHNSLKWISQPFKMFIYETPQDYEEDGYCLKEKMTLTEDEVLDHVLAINNDMEFALFVNRAIKDAKVHTWVMEDSALQFLGVYKMDRKESIKQCHFIWLRKYDILPLDREFISRF